MNFHSGIFFSIEASHSNANLLEEIYQQTIDVFPLSVKSSNVPLRQHNDNIYNYIIMNKKIEEKQGNFKNRIEKIEA